MEDGDDGGYKKHVGVGDGGRAMLWRSLIVISEVSWFM